MILHPFPQGLQDLLAQPLPDEPGDIWVMGVARGGGRPGFEQIFLDAYVTYYPDAGWPTHVLIRTSFQFTVVDYRVVEYLCTRKEELHETVQNHREE